MFTEQPAPPQFVAQVQPMAVDGVAQKEASALPPVQRAIADPEVLPPQSSSIVIPASTRSSAPHTPSTPASPAPTVQPSPAPVNAVTQRRQEIEQHLAEIVSQQRAAKKAEQQQKAETDAAKYGGAGDLEQARLSITKQALPKDVEAALLKKLTAKQGNAPHLASTTKNNAKPGSAMAGTAAKFPSLGIGATPGSYSTQPILPTAQPLMQFPMGLIGKNLNLILPLTIAAPITSGFGWRVHPITGTPRFHRGLDFGAPYGSPVVAAKAGIVESADFVDGYGLTIVIRHNGTQQTLYAHLSQVLVKPGDVVKQGSLIGQVGSTGFSTGPHLHFEFLQMMAQGWVAIDPGVLLDQAIATARNLNSAGLSARKQTVQLSASGVLDIAPSPLLANSMIPGFSLLSEVPSPALERRSGALFPFAFLPTATPEFSWFLSSLIDNFLIEYPTPFASFLTPSAPSQQVSFQSLPVLEKSPELATAAIVTLQKNPAMAKPKFTVSQLTTFHSALTDSNSATSLPVTTARTSLTTPPLSSTGTDLSHLTAYHSSISKSAAQWLGQALPSRLAANLPQVADSPALRRQVSAARQKTLPVVSAHFKVPAVHPGH